MSEEAAAAFALGILVGVVGTVLVAVWWMSFDD